jgi:hypothetical protein
MPPPITELLGNEERIQDLGEVALVVGLITAVLALTSAVAQTERGANRIYGVQRDRPFGRHGCDSRSTGNPAATRTPRRPHLGVRRMGGLSSKESPMRLPRHVAAATLAAAMTVPACTATVAYAGPAPRPAAAKAPSRCGTFSRPSARSPP